MRKGGLALDRVFPIGINSVVAIAAGEFHSVALRSNGDVYTWGRNSNGQLALGTTQQANSPTLVLSGLGAAIGAGHTHTLVVRTNGTVWAAGLNGNGQLGDGTNTQQLSLVQMSGIAGATKAIGGRFHLVVLLDDGTLKAVGANNVGQLGDGTFTPRTTPVVVGGVSGVIAVTGGAATCRRTPDTLVCTTRPLPLIRASISRKKL